jgi:acyl carrier protein
MNKDKVKQIVLDIISEIAPDEDLSDVKPEIRLRDQLDLDSMDFLDIVMELRKQHGIDVPEAEYRQLESLGQLWKLSSAQVRSRCRCLVSFISGFTLRSSTIHPEENHFEIAVIGAGLSGLSACFEVSHVWQESSCLRKTLCGWRT